MNDLIIKNGQQLLFDFDSCKDELQSHDEFLRMTWICTDGIEDLLRSEHPEDMVGALIICNKLRQLFK